MARPTKQGIDYFPIDCQFDDEIQLFLAENGADSLGILVVTWQIIYQNDGYYVVCDKRFPLKIKQRILSEVDRINHVITEAIEWGIFDKNIYKKHKILTSVGIQKRYLIASRLKKVVKLYTDLMLIDVSNVENSVNVVGNPNNVVGNATKVNVKVKEKVKEEVVDVITYLNEKADKSFRPVVSNLDLISARIKEGYTIEDIYRVIDNKVLQWKEDEKMSEYLRPATLFNARNFNQYVGEKQKMSNINNQLEGAI